MELHSVKLAISLALCSVLVSVFDYDTARGSGGLNETILQENFMTGRANVPGYTTFLGKPAFDLANEALYNDGVVPAPLASRAGDNADFAVNPSLVRRHALIILYTSECPYSNSTICVHCEHNAYGCVYFCSHRHAQLSPMSCWIMLAPS